MASFVSTGSPRSSRKSTPIVTVLDQGDADSRTLTSEVGRPKYLHASRSSPTPLKSSKLSNLQQTKPQDKNTADQNKEKAAEMAGMEDILSRLRLNDTRKPSNPQVHTLARLTTEPNALDKLLTDLNGKNKALKKQEMDLKDESESDNHKDEDRSSGSSLFTPATDSFDVASDEDFKDQDTVRLDNAEILRVKQELAAARSLISRQEQELAESRTLKHTMDQAIGPPSEADFGHHDVSEQTIGHLQSAFNASAPSFTMDSNGSSWHRQEASRPDSSQVLSSGRGRGIWNDQVQAAYGNGLASTAGPLPLYINTRDAQLASQAYGMSYGSPMSPIDGSFPTAQRSLSGSGSSGAPFGFDGRYGMDPLRQAPSGIRRNINRVTSGSGFSDTSSLYGGYGANAVISPTMNSPIGAIGPQQSFAYPPRQLGPPLSPTGSDFTVGSMPGMSAPWSTLPPVNGQTYVTSLEPMNYRRLLDKSVSCDWKYIVDKIVCSNDQQASIFLQQKLKVGTAEQKFEIVESIVNQAYPLMINRFGNFLVQRCFEHGTPEQVVAIANAIHGNVLSLSMDAFGCHVIQKAFDSVPENHKADMVRELLRRIPDTVIHRYACHVWQKLFELRWSGEPPQIMLKVNEALRGMWHEVALGETGSLVVQNIFENCVEEEKRPAIEEVIGSIDLIAHGQFGNWCIQHLCEHGSPPDKRRVIDHILANSYSYSIDQFASKVVEKCLKIGGVEFLDRYLGVITNALPDRPRIPLIDIAGDQYGNYLIQWILMNTHHHQREQVAVHIRKHMVSLRGSKFGSRVAMLCCNPASVTRPGPGAIVNPFGAPGQPRGWGRFR